MRCLAIRPVSERDLDSVGFFVVYKHVVIMEITNTLGNNGAESSFTNMQSSWFHLHAWYH